jgi:hypothetical protein
MKTHKVYGKLYKCNIFSIVMEYANNGDVYGKIEEHKRRSTFFAENDIWKILI